MKRTVGWLLKTSALMAILVGTGFGQDFEGDYNLQPGGRINIANVSGDIIVSGYEGSTVSIRAFKEGPDRDLVEIEDLSTGNQVSLRAKYPRHGNCNAGIQFELQIPRGLEVDIDSLKTASGNIQIDDVFGDVSAKSASGNLTISRVDGYVSASTASGDVIVTEIIGMVKASTASGDVEVEITELEGDGKLSFSSASGNVHVSAPADLDADVRMSTASGKVSTDFALTVEEGDYGPGQKAHGRLGDGIRELKISSASGNVSLRYSRR